MDDAPASDIEHSPFCGCVSPIIARSNDEIVNWTRLIEDHRNDLARITSGLLRSRLQFREARNWRNYPSAGRIPESQRALAREKKLSPGSGDDNGHLNVYAPDIPNA
jgi:hypothetical protein